MPIKVRCPECNAGLNVSDKAAGRAVKCRQCGGRVPVPSGGGKRTSAPRKRRRPETDPDDIFGGVDLRAAEHTSRRVCPNPKCASPVGLEDEVCPKCGFDIETGVLNERERLRRSRKGPPPEEFYGKVWSDGWKFLKKHKGFAVATGVIWGMTCTMAICSAFVLNWYGITRAAALRESADGVQFTSTHAIIDPSEDQKIKYDGKTWTRAMTKGKPLRLPVPEVAAFRSPPAVFWIGMLSISILGFGGWAWILATKIVSVTMEGGKKIERFHSDLFGAMAMGFRTIFWPLVVMLPFVAIPVAVTVLTKNPVAIGASWGVLMLTPLLLLLPAGLAHMVQKFSFRAWLLMWLGKDFGKTIGPSLFLAGLALLLVFGAPLGIGAAIGALWPKVSAFYTNQVEMQILPSIVSYDAESSMGFFNFTFLRLPLLGMIAFTGSFIFWMIIAFPAIFMMRAYGLYGLYFRPDLSLVSEQIEFSPAGFGPRLVAFLIDSVLMAALVIVMGVVALVLSKLFGLLYSFSDAAAERTFYGLWISKTLGAWETYFASWESGQNRGTLGKNAVGIIVLGDDDKPISLKTGFQRFTVCILNVLTLGGTFAMCLFNPEKKTLPDKLTKTKVVWREDEKG